MKELIKQLRVGACVARDRGIYGDFAEVADKAADALGSLTVENQCLSDSCKTATEKHKSLTADRDMWAEQAESVAEHNISLIAQLKICQDLRIIDDKVAQHLKARHKAEVDEDLIERDALKEGLDGWHARYLDVQTELDSMQRHENKLEDLERENAALRADGYRAGTTGEK